MTPPLFTTIVEVEEDLVLIRQRARRLAESLGFDSMDQTRIASAVSEMARAALRLGGGAVVRFALNLNGRSSALAIEVTDRTPLADDPANLRARDSGVTSARRLMDSFTMHMHPGEAVQVRMSKSFTGRMPPPERAQLARLATMLAAEDVNPLVELSRQNAELIESLELLQRRQEELVALNRELEDTNQGVLALYAELDDKAGNLRRAHTLKTHVLSNISHEFRTPVNSILALSRMLLEQLDGPLNTEQRQQVSYIRQGAESLSELVNDLLDMAKIEAGKLDLHIRRFTVIELFGALRGMMRPLLQGPQVQFHLDAPQGLPSLQTDQGKLAQILRNLLSNAVKFTPHGSITGTAHYDAATGVLTFQVADTGIGIAAEDQERIFEEFWQVDTPLQRGVGTGLGLALSRQLARLLGGTLSVDSMPGQGSVFTLAIPALLNLPAQPAATIPLPATTPAAQVLLIDDDSTSRYLLRHLLNGLRVHEAADGEAGLRAARTARPQVIILDLMMPGLDGFEVLRRLKAEPETRAIPVIVNSSSTLSPGDRTRLALAEAILPKGELSPAVFIRTVTQFVANAEAP